MKLIVGLGNPEKRFEGTRHNIGFAVIDDIISPYRRIQDGLEGVHCGIPYYDTTMAGDEVTCIKPQDWMNSSGISVLKMVNDFDFKAEDVILIHDDMDFDLGVVRIRFGGGHGRHNGVKSVIEKIGKDFTRVRMGIGRPARGTSRDYVLSKFPKEEHDLMRESIVTAFDAVHYIIGHGVQQAMAKFNRREPNDEGREAGSH
jgi:PTH1 family peptidyl-tRNA hydrolase